MLYIFIILSVVGKYNIFPLLFSIYYRSAKKDSTITVFEFITVECISNKLREL